jgi:L-lysine exporter family protein LysE/ArgO
MLEAAVSGWLVAISLIAAIGAQNAFVLRQGLRQEHVAAVVAFCATSDALLIVAGVTGFGAISARLPWLGTAMLWLGVGFLLVYGALRFRAAWIGGAELQPAAGGGVSLRSVLGALFVITWANPHVYLDTVVLIGSLSAQHAPHGAFFGAGAALGSATFFIALGYGARLLAPVMARPRAWVVLEIGIGLTMWAIAAGLAFSG